MAVVWLGIIVTLFFVPSFESSGSNCNKITTYVVMLAIIWKNICQRELSWNALWNDNPKFKHAEYNKVQLKSNKPHVATGTRHLNCCDNSINYGKNQLKNTLCYLNDMIFVRDEDYYCCGDGFVVTGVENLMDGISGFTCLWNVNNSQNYIVSNWNIQ